MLILDFFLTLNYFYLIFMVYMSKGYIKIYLHTIQWFMFLV